MRNKKPYLSINQKFGLTVCVAIIWTIACFIIDREWFLTLADVLTFPVAIVVVFGIAIIPGVMICFYSLGGLFFDKPRHISIVMEELEDITVLIAAYNEEDCIYDTLKSLSLQDYPRRLAIKVIDNNSADNTKYEVERAIQDFKNLDIKYLFEPKQGKFNALNKALPYVDTNYFITIDADTYLFKDAILKLSNRMIQENKNKKVGAIAGTVLVRNSRTNILTKLQEWEYFLSMATIKRSQGLFQTTMVAQGAFSIYRTDLVLAVGGYADAIVEDMVLTWELLSCDDKKIKPKKIQLNIKEETRTYYCDDAIAFTNVPIKFKHFFQQRVRWARGSIEGFRHFRRKECSNTYTKLYMAINLTNIIGEVSMVCIFIPGLILALFFRNFLFIGWYTLLLFLITVFIYIIMWNKQWHNVFEPMGLRVRRHYLTFILYMCTYSLILAPICVWGYISELLHLQRRWGK